MSSSVGVYRSALPPQQANYGMPGPRLVPISAYAGCRLERSERPICNSTHGLFYRRRSFPVANGWLRNTGRRSKAFRTASDTCAAEGPFTSFRVTPQIVALTQRSEAEGVGLGAGRGRCKRRAGCTGRVAVALRLIEHPQRLEQHRLRAVGDGARALAALEVDLERAVGPGDHLVHRLFAG